MNTRKLTHELYLQLEKHGLKGKIVSIKHLHELREGIEERHKKGEFDEEFYQKELTWFDFKGLDNFPNAKSVLVVATPQPQIQVIFTLNEISLPVIIPPTYFYGTDEQAKTLLEGLLKPEGYRLMKAALPLKLLADRSGLAQYGKNNITYVPGLGSFQRLAAFYTDLPCVDDNWGEPQLMETCQTCVACVKACPTNAIASDRFLLHAERCITFLNEFPGEFPDWLDLSWHNCLVGCLICQKCCPVNKDVVNWIEEKAQFSEEETRLLLQSVSRNEPPAETVRKLEQLGIIEYIGVLPRNLSVLFEKRNIPSNKD